MNKPEVSIISLLAGAAVAGGDTEGSLDLAAVALSQLDAKAIVQKDLIFYNALSYSVAKQVPLDLEVFKVFLDSQPLEDKDKLIALRRFSDATKVKASKAKFLSLLAGVDLALRRQKLVDRMFAASLALDGDYYDEQSRIRYSGLEGAQDLLGQALLHSSTVASDRFPSGNVLEERDEILAEYAAFVQGENLHSVASGFASIDNVTLGFSTGELVLIGAYTGEGKSMLVVNMAWSAAIEQSKNVAVITAETLRPQYRRRLLVRHSCHSKFGVVNGIPSKEIRAGALSEDTKKKYLEVVEDFTSNPNYGYLNILQVTSGATMQEIRRELEAINIEVPLDIVFIDYLALLSASRRRQQRQEEIKGVIQESKEMAITFNGGKGIVCVSAHQMSAQAREAAKPIEGKFYSVRDFADTSEAGKSADVALALLRTPDLEAQNEVCVGFLKCRDSALGPLFTLYENYAASYLGDMQAAGDTII